jgi:engulfment/cell motility protein 1
MSSTTSGKKWRYYKLSTSQKTILFGDFSDKFPPVLRSFDKLTNRIELSSVYEIKQIQRYPGLSMTGSFPTGTLTEPINNNTSNLSFALYNDKNVPLAEFHCSSAAEAAEWKDGFSMLLDKRFASKETAELFHTLTEVGVKVKLLQIAGDRVEIPHSAVEIPPVPPGLGSGFFYNTIE